MRTILPYRGAGALSVAGLGKNFYKPFKAPRTLCYNFCGLFGAPRFSSLSGALMCDSK